MGVKQQDKFTISLMSALLFFVVANPETFKIMRNVVGTWVSSPTGCPSTKGLIFQTGVYLLITWLLMNINKVEKADGSDSNGGTPSTIVGASTGDDSSPDLPPTPADTMTSTTQSVQPYTGEDAGTYTTCSCQNGKNIMIMN